MRAARAFVQHSIVASDGNSEGMPVSILEASATGLPIVATRHAGIPEAVVDGETGLLVDERDVDGMAAHMGRLASDPAFAAALGSAGRGFVEKHFSLEVSLARLWEVIYATARSASTSSSSA
jgi:glycosyltransferase involved in cell wall biosynthesis